MPKQYPQQQLDGIEPTKVQSITRSLNELHKMGKPKSDNEVRERISKYFELCENSTIRPGIESLACGLSVSRQCLYQWANGINCSEERQEMIQSAKAFISAFLEQCSLSGQVSPPVGIFLLKNWCGYRDVQTIEEFAGKMPQTKKQRTPEQIAEEYGLDSEKDVIDVSDIKMPED